MLRAAAGAVILVGALVVGAFFVLGEERDRPALAAPDGGQIAPPPTRQRQVAFSTESIV